MFKARLQSLEIASCDLHLLVVVRNSSSQRYRSRQHLTFPVLRVGWKSVQLPLSSHLPLMFPPRLFPLGCLQFRSRRQRRRVMLLRDQCEVYSPQETFSDGRFLGPPVQILKHQLPALRFCMVSGWVMCFNQVVGVATVTATDPDGEQIFRETRVTQALVQHHALSVGECGTTSGSGSR